MDYAWLMRLHQRCWQRWRAAGEATRLSRVRATQRQAFVIVSSERHAGALAIRCLDSVHAQHYDPAKVTHLLIDDASTDDTPARITAWLATHPGHRVQYLRTDRWRGGCANNLWGFGLAPPGSVILELNGDDWLPEPGVLAYLDRLYADPGIWLTYGTYQWVDGRLGGTRSFPAEMIRQNRFREYPDFARHLQSFRQELLASFPETALIDPATGAYFVTGYDKAFYLGLCELAGTHCYHAERITYVASVAPPTRPDYGTVAERRARAARVRQLPRLTPLASLRPGIGPAEAAAAALTGAARPAEYTACGREGAAPNMRRRA